MPEISQPYPIRIAVEYGPTTLQYYVSSSEAR